MKRSGMVGQTKRVAAPRCPNGARIRVEDRGIGDDGDRRTGLAQFAKQSVLEEAEVNVEGEEQRFAHRAIAAASLSEERAEQAGGQWVGGLRQGSPR